VPCEGDLECGTVDVPLDYSNADSGTVSIALVRRPASGEAKGSIFVNPGGPGASGIDFVTNGFRLDPVTSSTYHVVGFDPRGIGRSAPLTCDLDRVSGVLPDLSPDTASEVAELDDEARRLVQRCQATDSALLPHLTTLVVARDLDRLRRAVGDDELDFYGLSYGTLLAARYLELFPESAGRLVLDGVVDPELDLPDLLAQQAAAFEEGFARLEQRCESDGPCPPGGLLASFDRLNDRLEAAGPVDEIGASELVMASLLPVYNPAIWPQYRDALVEADAGRMADLGRLSDFFTGSVSFSAYAAFACADSDIPVGSNGWTGLADRLERLSPRFGAVIANELRVCSIWPDPDPEFGRPVPVAGSPAGSGSVLVIGTTGDAATPYENAERAVERFERSHLITVDGQRHTAYGGSECVRRIVADFFADELAVPGRSACDLDPA
jgi:pimeloyl-ACP methyl ester carboxylesterase